MEKLSVHQKNTKQAKAKKKPIKVVYISNPMKVKASASEFRDLVQELTGRDSNVADLSRLPAVEESGDPPPAAPESSTGPPTLPNPATNRSSNPCDNALKSVSGSDPYDVFDEAFNPQMLENLPGFSPSPLYYEPQTHGFRDDYDAS
ncbi:sigma factor binding protein 1, chloroplastic [Cocos nucifera]|nr:sigma factor binding protein 1, chloroplastic [Cocos nucifera]